MSREHMVVEFQKEYSMLDNKFLKADKDLFDVGVLIAHTSELEKGFMVKKQLKTTSKGTKFNYKRIETKEEANIYFAKVREMAESFDPKVINEKLEKRIKGLSNK